MFKISVPTFDGACSGEFIGCAAWPPHREKELPDECVEAAVLIPRISMWGKAILAQILLDILLGFVLAFFLNVAGNVESKMAARLTRKENTFFILSGGGVSKKNDQK